MAAGSAQITIATTATLITQVDADGGQGESLLVKNIGSATVYLGGAGVTTSNGYPFAAGDVTGTNLAQNEQIYGVVASGTGTVAVLAIGV